MRPGDTVAIDVDRPGVLENPVEYMYRISRTLPKGRNRARPAMEARGRDGAAQAAGDSLVGLGRGRPARACAFGS